jgi:integrase
MQLQLTETQIRAAKPNPTKAYKMTDSRGLFLRVRPNGTKSWLTRYVINGKEGLLSLGVWPEVQGKRAREKRDELRKLVADGVDPSKARKAKKAARLDTFESIAELWLDKQSKIMAPITVQTARSRIETQLYPAFGSTPIANIEAPDLLAVLQRIEAGGTHETAHRLRSLFSRVARHAIAIGKAKRDISWDLRGALVPVKVDHHAAITEPRQIGALLRAVDNYEGFTSVSYALKLSPLVFVRPGELRGAAWVEFDLEALEPVWRIPSERMKMKVPHIVPLAKQSVAILRELHQLTGSGRLLFPGLRTPDRPISNNSVNAALRYLGFPSHVMTHHGFRTLASTRLNEMNINSDLIELQLAHTESNKVRAAYNQARRLPERRAMMQTWADALDEMRGGKP